MKNIDKVHTLCVFVYDNPLVHLKNLKYQFKTKRQTFIYSIVVKCDVKSLFYILFLALEKCKSSPYNCRLLCFHKCRF